MASLSAAQLMDIFNSNITSIANIVAPERSVTRRIRRSDLWFDDECRSAKKECRKLERRVRRSADDDVIRSTWQAKLRSYRQLVNRKRSAFWSSQIESHQKEPRRMWRLIDDLLGRVSNASVNDSLTCDDFNRFFHDKVAGIRARSDNAGYPVFTPAPSHCQLDSFCPVSAEDVSAAIRSLPAKQCSLDPLPTWLLKMAAQHITPFTTSLVNTSLSTGHFPPSLKSAYISPRLKKPGLDDGDVCNYRPISNLPVMAKLIERLVAKQLISYLNNNNLLPSLQSAYRPLHSTETALIKVTSDILMAIDRGELVTLALLDLSAAFDTVDHEILLRRLSESYGITGVALDWFQ